MTNRVGRNSSNPTYMVQGPDRLESVPKHTGRVEPQAGTQNGRRVSPISGPLLVADRVYVEEEDDQSIRMRTGPVRGWL